MFIDTTALPAELLTLPQPLVGFFGLDLNNSLHKSVWDAFSNKKTNGSVMQFKLLPSDYEFPLVKHKRTSYEWYIPKGILKKNWMVKHMHILPAVVVAFFEMEWDDAEYKDKQLKCASIMLSLKNSLRDHDTSLCLVLLQKYAPLPAGENPLASERAVSLTIACGINNKLLFILPHTEHLLGYTLRLESAFHDMALNYYNLMSKKIRAHRDQLTTSNAKLLIRHQFKLGFLSEIRQDISTALKHYIQAYDNLDASSITNINYLEIKTIAGFLNYKICQLMFKLKVPRDAINHFIIHVEKFKNCIEDKDLTFEHFAWISTQYNTFAELFCDAIKNGLPALQSQHPGIYYHKAAEFISKRREEFLFTSVASPNQKALKELETKNLISSYTEFYGIRELHKEEHLTENQLNLLIRENEKCFNHSGAIINLLGQAMAQFKIYKCLRFRKKLAVDMADEYLKNGDYAKALTLFSLMLPDYRQENWLSIFSIVLFKTLQCALQSASVTDYILCCLEALSLKIPNDQTERLKILENLWKIFQLMPPVDPEQITSNVWELWQNSLKIIKSPIQIDLDTLTQLFEIHVTFDNAEYKNDELIKINSIIKVLTDVPIKVQNISVLLENNMKIYKCSVVQFSQFNNLNDICNHFKENAKFSNVYKNFTNNFKLEPNFYYGFTFTADARLFSENTQLKIISVEILVGTNKLFSILQQKTGFAQAILQENNRRKYIWDNIKTIPVCYIIPAFHLSMQTHFAEKNIMVNEYQYLSISINNPFNIFLQNVGLQIKVPNQLLNSVFLATDISPSRQKLHQKLQFDIGELAKQSLSSISFYIFCLKDIVVTLQQKLWYTVDIGLPKLTSSNIIIEPLQQSNYGDSLKARLLNPEVMSKTPLIQIEFLDEMRVRKFREDLFNLKCEQSFKFIGRFYTLSKKPLNQLFDGENFCFRASVEKCSENPFDILETYFVCDSNFTQSLCSFKGKKRTNKNNKIEKLEDVIFLHSTPNEFSNINEYQKNKTCNHAHNSQCDHKFNTKKIQRKNCVNFNSLFMQCLKANTTSSNKLIQSFNNSYGAFMENSPFHKNWADICVNVKQDKTENFKQSTKSTNPRYIFRKAIDFIQATGHSYSFKRGVFRPEPVLQQSEIPFGVYAIRWKRIGSKFENETKFIISGLKIDQPPFNIYCSIDEKMFVKMPMTLKIKLRNRTANVLHLKVSLNINNSDNFICSGHRQIDISIFAYSQKDLLYNLYPLCVGWQRLPELQLHYNSQEDSDRNNILTELVQRSMPKMVFVMPPLK